MIRDRQRGFTLVETVVAMILVSAVILPVSLWLYRSRVNHAAWERFQATQMLEQRMNRAVLLRFSRDWSEQPPGAAGLRFIIRVEDEAGERRLLGKAQDRRGKDVVSLEATLFERGGP